MAEDLAPIFVYLVDGERASGLADLLAQYLEQSLAASARKRSHARRLRGELSFHAAEDEALAVRVRFEAGRVDLRDVPPGVSGPWVKADFLSLARLASGAASPLWMVLARKVRLFCPPRRLFFLLDVLGFLRLEDDDADRARRRAWLAAALVASAAALLLAWWFVR